MRMQTNRLSVFGESERSDLPSQTEVEMLVISCAGCSLDNDHAPARTTLPLSVEKSLLCKFKFLPSQTEI